MNFRYFEKDKIHKSLLQKSEVNSWKMSKVKRLIDVLGFVPKYKINDKHASISDAFVQSVQSQHK